MLIYLQIFMYTRGRFFSNYLVFWDLRLTAVLKMSSLIFIFTAFDLNKYMHVLFRLQQSCKTWAPSNASMCTPSVKIPSAHELTFALQALPHEAPQQGATVVTEGGDLVVVDAELMGHVNTEPLWTHLQRETHTETNTHTVLQRGHRRIIGGIMHVAQVLVHSVHMLTQIFFTKILNGELYSVFSARFSVFSRLYVSKICNSLLINNKCSTTILYVFLGVCMSLSVPHQACPPASSSRHTWWWWAHGSACGRHTYTLEAQQHQTKFTWQLVSIWLAEGHQICDVNYQRYPSSPVILKVMHQFDTLIKYLCQDLSY